MSLCHIVYLLILGAIVFCGAAYFTYRDERKARFRERIEIEEDERVSERDLP